MDGRRGRSDYSVTPVNPIKQNLVWTLVTRLSTRGSIRSRAVMPFRFSELRFCSVIAIVSQLLCTMFWIDCVFTISFLLPSGTWPGWPSTVGAVGIRRDSISIKSGFLVLSRDKRSHLSCILRPVLGQHTDLPCGTRFDSNLRHVSTQICSRPLWQRLCRLQVKYRVLTATRKPLTAVFVGILSYPRSSYSASPSSMGHSIPTPDQRLLHGSHVTTMDPRLL